VIFDRFLCKNREGKKASLVVVFMPSHLHFLQTIMVQWKYVEVSAILDTRILSNSPSKALNFYFQECWRKFNISISPLVKDNPSSFQKKPDWGSGTVSV